MLSDLKYIDDINRWEDKDGCTWEDKASYLQIAVLDLCGCGTPDDVMKYIYGILKRIELKIDGEYEDNAYMFFMYWANKKGFSEHGTTVRCSWLTDLGKQLIKDIEECIKELEEQDAK